MQEHIYRATPFDSHFRATPDAAEMTLRVYVHVQPYVPNIASGEEWELVRGWPHDETGTQRKVVSWENLPDGEESFSDWTQRFKSVIEDSWSGHLYLVGRTPGRGYRLGLPIRCYVDVRFVEREDRSHLNLAIYRLHETETFFRSSMHRGGNCKRVVSDGTLDHRDIDPKSNGQIAAVHEFGHYIGLDHVAQGTPTPYGAPGSYQAGDIMGSGMRRDAWHAWPWLNRLPLHQVSRPPGGVYPSGVDWQRSLGPGR